MNDKKNLPDWGEIRDKVPGVRDEWECIDLKCSHFDGDQCTLGGCFDPPEEGENENNS